MMRGDLKSVLSYVRDNFSATEEQISAMSRLFKSKPETKRPMNAFMLWLNDNRGRIKSENEGIKHTDVAKLGGEEWKGLSDDERAPYTEKAQKAKEEYAAGRGETRTAKPSSKNWDFDLKTSYDCDSETPDGFNGPHKGKYLHGLTEAGRARGKGVFETLSDAVEAANALGSKCGGITKMKSGYQLRLGGDLLEEKNVDYCDDVITWKKNSDDVETFSIKQSKKKVEKAIKPVEQKVETSNDDDDDHDETSSSDTSTKDPESAPAKDTFKEEDSMSAAGSDDEDGSDEEDSEDDDEMDATEWEYKGVTYILDEQTNQVYDRDTQQLIGRRVAGKLKKNKK